MKPVIYERTLRVPYYLGDRYNRMTLPHLMNVLIEISGEQTAQIGVPPAEELGLSWIILQYDLDINRLPKTNENITVKTFAKEYNRLFSYREFEVYDEEENLLLEVMTVFALMNEKRKLARLPDELVQGYGSTENRRIRRMPKPETPENLETANRKDYEVRFYDIDTNFHANNSMYYVWMLDALGDEFLATHEPIHGNITFEKEVHIGDEIESYVDFAVDENDVLISRHQVKVGDINKCTATFKWIDSDVEYSK